jgi:hypothetical protein
MISNRTCGWSFRNEDSAAVIASRGNSSGAVKRILPESTPFSDVLAASASTRVSTALATASKKALSFGGKRQLPRRTLQELRAKPLLERLDPSADRRFGEPHPPRRSREAARPHHLDEYPRLVEVHYCPSC